MQWLRRHWQHGWRTCRASTPTLQPQSTCTRWTACCRQTWAAPCSPRRRSSCPPRATLTPLSAFASAWTPLRLCVCSLVCHSRVPVGVRMSVVCVFVCLCVCCIASKLHATAVIRYTHCHTKTHTDTHRHTQTHTNSHILTHMYTRTYTYTYTQTIPSDLGSALPLSAHHTRIHAHSTPFKLNVSA